MKTVKYEIKLERSVKIILGAQVRVLAGPPINKK